MAIKVEGPELRELSIRLKAADRALWLATARNLRAAAKPAAKAVQDHERAVLPKRGGLNEWVASTPVGVRVTTGARSAGVRLVQTKKGRTRPHDLRRMNDQGLVRHPVFGNAKVWVEQDVPKGFWDGPLLAMRPEVTAAMLEAMHEASRVAGFR